MGGCASLGIRAGPQPGHADVIGLLDNEMPAGIKACKRPGKRKCEDQTQQPKSSLVVEGLVCPAIHCAISIVRPEFMYWVTPVAPKL
jgi:hypothetical protein